MRKLLFAIAFMMTITMSSAKAINLPFDDLSVGTDVLNSYGTSQGITFSTGLYVTNDGAYDNPDKGAKIQGPNIVTMASLQGIYLLSFYFNGAATLNAYGSQGELVFQETANFFESGWSPYAASFNSAVYQVDFIVSSGDFLVDAITDEGHVIPEPSTLILLGSSLIGLVGIRIKRKKR